jgi:hypothetical protein
MADDLLFVLSSPGSVPLEEFNDWYDNEHVPARLATSGFGSIARFRASDGLVPEWLATYEITPGLLGTPAYQALVANGSAREKSSRPRWRYRTVGCTRRSPTPVLSLLQRRRC